jgi:thioredoxin 1
MKKRIVIGALSLVALLAVAGALRFQFSKRTPEATLAESHQISGIPLKDMVTMLDLGASSCIPCKMMAPIIERVEKNYKGKAAIIFVDVWKNQEPAKRFGIRAIPTQIFFDKQGKEVYRHVGFMSEAAIVAQLKKMGVN